MSEIIDVEVEPQDVTSGWLVARLKRLEVSVTIAPKNYESRKVTAELDFTEENPVLVALALFPGSGTQPENTITLQNVQDQSQLVLDNLKFAIDQHIQNNTNKEW